MKIGFCTGMFSNESDKIGEKYIAAIAKAGFNYVELPLTPVVNLDKQQFNHLKETLLINNISCECCNVFFPAHLRLTGDDVSVEAINSYVKDALEKAKELGVKIVVLGSSGAKNVPDGFSYTTAYNQIIEALKIIDIHAKNNEIIIAIEPLNRDESNIIVNSLEGLQLVKEINSENVKLLIDYYHFSLENEQVENIINSSQFLVHTHFAEPEGRSFPVEIAERYKPFFNTLKEIGYDGRMSVEANFVGFDNDATINNKLKNSFDILKELSM